MREVITMGAAIMLAALTWTASQPHSLAAEQQTAAAAKAPKILLRATLSLAQPPFAGAVESVQADGQLRIGPLKAKSGVAVPENGPLTEGLYLGVVRGTYKDLRDANLLRVNVTNITTEGVVDAQVGRGLDDRILVGKLILLVRPPQSTSAQLKALPDLVTIETGPAPISDPVASTPDATPPAAESARRPIRAEPDCNRQGAVQVSGRPKDVSTCRIDWARRQAVAQLASVDSADDRRPGAADDI